MSESRPSDNVRRPWNRVGKWLGLLAAIALILFVVAWESERRQPRRYLIPDGYVGWLRVDYGVNAAHARGYGVDRAYPLPVENGFRIYRFPASGHIVTSSSIEEGWAKDEFFYVADGKMTELSQAKGSNMIWSVFNGRVSGSATQTLFLFVGTEEEKNQYADRRDPIPKHGAIKRMP